MPGQTFSMSASVSPVSWRKRSALISAPSVRDVDGYGSCAVERNGRLYPATLFSGLVMPRTGSGRSKQNRQ